MTVVPHNAQSVIADGLDFDHPVFGFVHLERICGRSGRAMSRAALWPWLRSVRTRARGARTPIAKKFHTVGTVMPVFPIDLDALRL
jgi:hypothetical protein